MDSASGSDVRDGELEEAAADAVVVGAGIVGLTCALRLAEGGLDVVVVEADRIAAGVSGYTTAKLTAGHGLVYSRLESDFDGETAMLYAQAQDAAIRHVKGLVVSRGIDCDLEAQPNYVFTAEDDGLDELAAETEAARRAGLHAEDVASLDVPFPAVGATMLPDQAQFHPRRYLLAVAEQAESAGARIVTGHRVTAISGEGPLLVETEHGTVTAPVVVVATHYPIVEQGFFVPRIHPRRSYVVAAPLEQELAPGMYINAGSPTRSVRTARLPDGRRLLLLGGEGHRVGQEQRTEERYTTLERYLREHFRVGETMYRWSTQDTFSVDRLPYVGAASEVPGLYVATGFAGWGMSNGTMAGLLTSGLVLGEEPAWAGVFALDRGHLGAVTEVLRESANVGVQQAHGAVRSDAAIVDDIGRGEGAVLSLDGDDVGVSRDEAGALHAVSPKCTHMGCVVAWNEAESTWDCPCHGSRFAPTGEVLHGPALTPLEPVELDGGGEPS